MVPGTPTELLRFLSPVSALNTEDIVPYDSRSGILFFGFDNPANNMALSWFHREVFPHVQNDLQLHVAGHVYVPDVCECDSNGKSCKPASERVVCHGPLDDDELESLVKSSLVVLNPVLSKSGVATKTCRALAYGTPVVVSDFDGTFSGMTDAEVGSSASRCHIDDPEKVLCFANKVTELATTRDLWERASKSGPAFIEQVYGLTAFVDSWVSILDAVIDKPVKVVIEGEAIGDGFSLLSQNWHIANALSKVDNGKRFEVSIVGGSKIDPPIHGVQLATEGHATGYQADIVIRQSWPTPITPPPISYCGIGCRVATILPWEFGSLPLAWMSSLEESTDVLWAPTEYNRKVYEVSGFDPSRTAVISCGVDCEGLSAEAEKLAVSKAERRSDFAVRFVMTGGVLPRKGVDVMLEEWSDLFCTSHDASKPAAELIISTGYEYGFNEDDLSRLEGLVTECENGSIKWNRNTWLSREEYIQLLSDADFYVAPYRSEGFGISIAEAALLKTSVIATASAGTAAYDYLHPISDMVLDNGIHAVYPVEGNEEVCETYPCRDDSICVFADREDPCEKLTSKPTWFEVDRDSLRTQLNTAYEDAIKSFTEGHLLGGQSMDSSLSRGLSSVCYADIASEFDKQITQVISGPKRRSIKNENFVIAGLVYDGSSISDSSLHMLTAMSCLHNIRSHLIVAQNIDETRSKIYGLMESEYPDQHCATIAVDGEPGGLMLGRIHRIQQLRSMQRSKIQEYLDYVEDLNAATVVNIDFDLAEIPSYEDIMKHAKGITDYSYEVDAVCANGVEDNFEHTRSYFDTFATVLLPSTFVYPLKLREFDEPWPEEDPKFIVNPDGKEGSFSASSLFSWLEDEGRKRGTKTAMKPVPVRSCFGGLTIYRASKYLDPRCDFNSETHSLENAKYKNIDDKEPNEHIVWNLCMARADPDFTIGIQPDLITIHSSKDTVFQYGDFARTGQKATPQQGTNDAREDQNEGIRDRQTHGQEIEKKVKKVRAPRVRTQKQILEVVKKVENKNVLIMFPTIPVPFKGSDSRPTNSAEILVKLGCNVDFMYWRDFVTELSEMKQKKMKYDDTSDRENLLKTGVEKIMGPYDGTSEEMEAKLMKTDFSKYDAVFFWPWPDPLWLDTLKRMVKAVKMQKGNTKIVSMVEDPGLAVRDLRDNAMSRGQSVSFADVQTYLLGKRRVELLAMDEYRGPTEWTEGKRKAEEIFEKEALETAHNVFLSEQELYTFSDLVVGISSETQDFLRKVRHFEL